MHHVPKTRPIIAARRFSVARWPGKPPALEALCRPGDGTWNKPGMQRADGVPALDDCCGLHAYADTDTLLFAEGDPSLMDVDGLVALWGTVVEHEDGYRAEYGQVLEIIDQPPSNGGCNCRDCIAGRTRGANALKQLVAQYNTPAA